jgi:hypothetical protein
MQVKVVGRYTNPARRIDVYPGDEIEVPDALAEFLIRMMRQAVSRSRVRSSPSRS